MVPAGETGQRGKLRMRYFEELEVGQKFTSPTLSVDADAIKAFASEFDPQPFHLDDEAARGSVFEGLAASGWHTAAMTSRIRPAASGHISRPAPCEAKYKDSPRPKNP